MCGLTGLNAKILWFWISAAILDAILDLIQNWIILGNQYFNFWNLWPQKYRNQAQVCLNMCLFGKDMVIWKFGGHLGGHLEYFDFPKDAKVASVRSSISTYERCIIWNKTLEIPYFEVKLLKTGLEQMDRGMAEQL